MMSRLIGRGRSLGNFLTRQFGKRYSLVGVEVLSLVRVEVLSLVGVEFLSRLGVEVLGYSLDDVGVEHLEKL